MHEAFCILLDYLSPPYLYYSGHRLPRSGSLPAPPAPVAFATAKQGAS